MNIICIVLHRDSEKKITLTFKLTFNIITYFSSLLHLVDELYKQ